MHKQSNPQNNSLSYKGGTSLWFPLLLRQYCYFMEGGGGELFLYGIAVIFHATDDCQGSFSLALHRFLIESLLLSTCSYDSITSRVCFCIEGQSQGCVLNWVGSQHSWAWHEVAESEPSCRLGLMPDPPLLSSGLGGKAAGIVLGRMGISLGAVPMSNAFLQHVFYFYVFDKPLCLFGDLLIAGPTLLAVSLSFPGGRSHPWEHWL